MPILVTIVPDFLFSLAGQQQILKSKQRALSHSAYIINAHCAPLSSVGPEVEPPLDRLFTFSTHGPPVSTIVRGYVNKTV